MNVPMLTPTYTGLPDLPAIVELQQSAPWVCWKAFMRNGKVTKLPINPQTGLNASVSDPRTWGDFEQADRLARARNLNGVGIVLRPDYELIGIDIDKCIDEDGNFDPWARAILDCGETYAETSPSGNGIRMFARGKLDRTIKSDAAHVELYRDGRYLTVTGNHVHGTPVTIQAAPMTIEALIARVAEFQASPSPAPKAITPVALRPAGGDFFSNVNQRAMEGLSLWVPTIFGAAARPSANGGYRVSSKDLGRDLEEDLSIAPNGIVDFGTADMGDPQQGKRTPIDLAIEYGRGPDAKAAAFWLCGQLGVSPDAMGWDRDEFLPDDGYDASKLTVGERIDPETGEIVEGDSTDLQDLEDDKPDEQLGGADEQEDVPEWLLDPPGVVGEVAEWICSTTSKPIRLHAIGAALVVVGTLINRKVYTASESCGGVLYLAALAKAGAGKEAPQTAIRMALDAVSTEGSMHSPWHASQQSLGKCLFDSASTVMVVDEFADELKRMKGKGAASSFAAINSSMRSLWGMGFNGTWAPAVSLTNGKLIVKKPALSMYGAATIASFRDLLNSDDVTNGMFSRFLILPRFGKVVKGPEIRGIPKLPETLREKLYWLNHCVGDLHQVQAKSGYGELPDPVLVPFTDEAAELNAANVAEQDQLIEKSDEDRVLTLYARYAEYIKRVALILAAGASPADVTQATITAEHMRWAQGLVRWSMDQFVRMVREDMSENVWQAQYKLVLGIIRDAGGNVTRRVLGRKLDARVPKKVLDEILSALEADGRVRADQVKPVGLGRPTTVYRIVRKLAA